jgi:hypothetical protein
MMRKLTYALAAAAAIAAGVPTLANAGGVSVDVNGGHGYYGDRYDGPRFRFREHDREFRHRYYHHDYGDRDVVIRRHHWDND